MSSKGYLSLILHAHLPYVRHPEHDYFLEENWLYEAITETYIPLLEVFDKLDKDKIPFRITLSLTPTLVSMLQDALLQNRYTTYIERLIELAKKEITRTSDNPDFHDLALMYHQRFTTVRKIFVQQYKKNIISAFKKFQKKGYLEIIASCATHGYLPNLSINPSDLRAQIHIGVDHYTKTFGRAPKGFWLPECGYCPGIDQILKDAGITYFFVDSHGIINADPKPCYGVYAPIYCPSGVAVFGRDEESSKQVWSSTEGYPGDPDYREYYKDIGHEAESDYIGPYIHPDGIRVNTGIKYWRITGGSKKKQPYNPDRAQKKTAIHAGDFIFKRKQQIKHLSSQMDRKPIIISPYDAELFGHWWFEGSLWIDSLVRKIFNNQQTITMITPSEYLEKYPTNQLSLPSASSWGCEGYSEVWTEESNDWLYRHLHTAGERMVELTALPLPTESQEKNIFKRALSQAARELLLAQSSDWPFIMKTGTMVPYANKRVRLHINQFTRLYNDIKNNTIDKNWLDVVESRDNIFPNMDSHKYWK